MFFEDGVHSAAQISDALAMDDAHLENSALPARVQVFEHQVFDLSGLERVQIQHAINGKLDGLVHISKLLPFCQRERIDSDRRLGLKQPHHNALHH